MKLSILLSICSLVIFIGCATVTHVPVTPNVPEFTIEKPPELINTEWVLITINSVPYYALPRQEAIKLLINVDKMKEYESRCFGLIGVE